MSKTQRLSIHTVQNGGPQAEHILFKIQSTKSGNFTKSGFPVCVCGCADRRSGNTGPAFLNEGRLYVQHALDNLPVPTSPIFFFFNPFCVSLIQLPDWPNKHVFLTHALTQQPPLIQPVPGCTPALWSGCSASP